MGDFRPAPRFRTIQQFQPEYSPNKVTQYESERTGLRVVVVDQQGPKLYGYFVLATEIHDDSGAPHTLEHLCFMGSKSYQYKGFLDKLAARAYSNLNAWTATDHTAYTVETAGWAGMAQIIPVYLDHLILPTLTDSGCVTEVHHIDSEGNDAGVVYSEMQAIQNTAAEMIEMRAKRLMYPEGVGFRYETSGMLEPLRVLTPQRIRDFHKEMYQPKNLCVCLFGEVDHDDLLAILDQYEESILSDIPNPEKPFTRPWVESKQAPPIEKTVVERLQFPEEDESLGQIDIAFLGPDSNDIVECGALNVILLYLCGSPAAVLDNAIVETEQLASSIYFQIDSRPSTVISFTMTGVETDRLEEIEQRFFAILKEAMSKPLDMKFIQDCIDRQVRSGKFNAELSATAFVDYVISDYLFGKRDGSTLNDLRTLKQYTHELSSWSEAQWKDFITFYITEAKHISLLGVPSTNLAEQLKTDEEARLEDQKKRLGAEGIKKMGERLKAAQEENDREIPPEMLAKFEVPPVESIHFIHTAGARTGPSLEYGRPDNKYQQLIEKDGGDSAYPLFIAFEHIPSNFVRVHMLIGTETLPLQLRPYLSIYFETFFNLPVSDTRGGDVVPWEQVVISLERDTVGYAIDAGHQLGNVEALRLTFQVEIAKYSLAIEYIRKHLFGLIFDVERLENITSRLLADTVDAKRDGSDMLAALHVQTHLAPESITRARSTLTRALFLKRIRRRLKTHPEEVKKSLEAVRDGLFQFSNLRLLVITDLEKVASPVQAWNELLEHPSLDTKQPLRPLGTRLGRLSEAGLHPGNHSYVVPMATVDGSFLYAVSRGITSFDAPELPAIMVAIAYLNATEGPLWNAVRGPGLAYSCQMSSDIEGGFVTLDIYRSPNSYLAFMAAKDIIGKLASGEEPLEEWGLEGAISTIVMGMADEGSTLASAAGAKFIKEIMKGLSENYNEEILKKVRYVKQEEIRAVLGGMLSGVFRPEESDVLVTCGVGMAEVSLPW
jgi:Zn-dependent M16 (insulinase) family peptidase